MKKIAIFSTMVALTGFISPAWADRLDDIRKAGVLRVATFDNNPPFGFIDNPSKEIIGLDVDIARAIAKKMGVHLHIVPTNPANRIPLLLSHRVDLVVANFTITPERAQKIQFSIPYFSSGQQFMAKKGRIQKPDDVKNLRVGVDKGTTNEMVLRKQFPSVKIAAYDETSFAFAALRNGKVDAITQDGPKLIGLLALAGDAAQYEVAPFTISQDFMGIGMPKGENKLKQFVDEALLELETTGQAEQIHNTWFGPQTKMPLPRLHKIMVKNSIAEKTDDKNQTIKSKK